MAASNIPNVEAFRACLDYEAILVAGPQTGKSDAILSDFLVDVGKGYGADWQGIFINGTWGHVRNFILDNPGMGAVIHTDPKRIVWPGGECLRYAVMRNEQDLYPFYGYEYKFPWLGWDDLSQIIESRLYDIMELVTRTIRENTPCVPRVRATLSTEHLGRPEIKWVMNRFKS